eukprot:gene20378-biopygen16111
MPRCTDAAAAPARGALAPEWGKCWEKRLQASVPLNPIV